MRVSSSEEEIKRNNTYEKKNLKYINASLRQELINNKIHHRRLIFKNKKRMWWENYDIAAAVTLRLISRKTYLYLRKNVGLPLPGLSTTRIWTRNLMCLPGIQKELLSVLKVIKEVEYSCFKVVAIGSDMGGGNLSLGQNL
ncbi:hypothetical protein PR048_008823 [Dryococelus australis]|uniref:Ribosomal protein S14 n=1 Tax=Dryococelus australis TaxID=614101 RepID=A0ABQ9HY85_9NEOP|nr:hypothetical protein PR048_008823 [Dryococelus australis]